MLGPLYRVTTPLTCDVGCWGLSCWTPSNRRVRPADGPPAGPTRCAAVLLRCGPAGSGAAGWGLFVRGGLVWYVAGILSTLIVIHGWFGHLFRVVRAVLVGVVQFITTLGGWGFVGWLALLGIGLFIGGRWSERARGAFEAAQAWRRRTAHRD